MSQKMKYVNVFQQIAIIMYTNKYILDSMIVIFTYRQTNKWYKRVIIALSHLYTGARPIGCLPSLLESGMGFTEP
jgi:hypothetical protein